MKIILLQRVKDCDMIVPHHHMYAMLYIKNITITCLNFFISFVDNHHSCGALINDPYFPSLRHDGIEKKFTTKFVHILT